MTLTESRKDIIKEFLAKYCDPKPQYTGVSLAYFAGLLDDKIEQVEREFEWAK